MSGTASRPEVRAALVELAARSATFEERAAADWVIAEPPPREEIDAICRAVGLAPDALRVRGPLAKSLARARVRDPEALPGWASALEVLLDDPAPSFASFVQTAGEWLDRAASQVALAAQARTGLLDWLHRALVHPARFVLRDDQPQLASRGDWLALLKLYPVLARLVGSAYASWQRACEQLLHRVAADWTALGQTGAPALADIAVLTLRSAAHSAPPLRITLPGGRRVVYKCKDLRTAAWMTELARSVGLAPRAIVARDDYGWADYVDASPCSDAAQVARYYTRAGGYLRLFQALRATDMHGRNVVAAGEHPVFIDLDMILQPARGDRAGKAIELAARERFERSPLAVGLLPTWLVGEPGRRAANVGGLNRGGRDTLPVRASDSAEYVTPTLPVLDGKLATPAAHLAELVAGYRAMSAVLAERAHELVTGAADLRVAIQWRSGFWYEELAEHSLTPLLLTDGRLRDAFLTRVVLGLPDDRARTIARHELWAIRDGGVPAFEARPADDTLDMHGDGEVPGVFAAPALDRLELVRAPLDEDRDVDAIASAIGVEAEACDEPAPAIEVRASTAPPAAAPLDHAIALADVILDEAIAAGGEAAWIGASWHPTAGVRRLGVLPPDLLSGTAGLAVMFAYLHRRSGEPRFRSAAASVIALLTRDLQATVTRDRFRRGAFNGAGAQLYAVRKCAELLDDAALAELSRRFLAGLSPWPAAPGPVRDVIAGDAGLVLVAANVFDAASRPPSLEHVAAQLRAPAAAHRELYLDGTRWLTGLPAEREGIAWALARWDAAAGRAPAALPADASPLTRIACGEPVALAEPRASLDELVVTLAARDAAHDAALTERARHIAGAIVARRRDTGRWLDDAYVADRYHLSAISGLGALALALARIDAPELRCCARLVY